MSDGEEKEGLFSKYKKLFIGGTASVGAFTSVVFTYIDAKTDAIAEKVSIEISHIKETSLERTEQMDKKLDQIHDILIKIDDRVYNLTKRGN